MKYEEIYIKYLNQETDLILFNLKESFIEYYGESSKSKIESIFDSLVIVYLTKNPSQKTLGDKIEKSSFSYNELIAILLKNQSKLTEKDLIEYALNSTNFISNKLTNFKEKLIELSYSKLLQSKKINSISKNILLNMSKGCISKELEELFTEFVDDYTAGFSYAKTNHSALIAIRINKQGKIALHTLIHEINHQLQKEEIFKVINKDQTEQFFLVEGITNNHKDLVNELINEYVTKDIMDIFNQKFSSSLLDLKFTSGYLLIDQISGNVMKKVYTLLRKEIKERLINGNARTIRKLIDGENKENYQLLNIFYNKIKSNILELKENETIKTFSEYVNVLSENEKNRYVQFTNSIYQSIENNFFNYKRYEEDLKKKVSEMVEEGQTRKFK